MCHRSEVLAELPPIAAAALPGVAAGFESGLAEGFLTAAFADDADPAKPLADGPCAAKPFATLGFPANADAFGGAVAGAAAVEAPGCISSTTCRS
jgi:hypothetical protein